MKMSSRENIFRVTYLCEGTPPVTGGFPSQRPVTRSFDVFFDPRLGKRLSKQSGRRWFETYSSSLWRHCNDRLFPCPYAPFVQLYMYRRSNTWWRHEMETFSALLAIYAGNSLVPGEFPAQSPMTRSFDVFFDLRLNKRLSKQSWGWWFGTLSHPLLRQCNEVISTNTARLFISYHSSTMKSVTMLLSVKLSRNVPDSGIFLVSHNVFIRSTFLKETTRGDNFNGSIFPSLLCLECREFVHLIGSFDRRCCWNWILFLQATLITSGNLGFREIRNHKCLYLTYLHWFSALPRIGCLGNTLIFFMMEPERTWWRHQMEPFST